MLRSSCDLNLTIMKTSDLATQFMLTNTAL